MTVIGTLPPLDVSLAGKALDERLLSGLVRVDVEQRMNAPASCELEFSDPHGHAADAFTAGATLALRIGPARQSIFEGTVAALELVLRGDEVRTLRVLAYDALDLLRRGSPVRVHSEVTFADLARELTLPFGIAVDFDSPGTLQTRVVQHRRSDFDVLLHVAEREGRYVRLDGGVLRTYRIAPSGDAKRLELGVDVREASVTLSDVDAASTVDVRGWDPQRIRGHRGTAMRNSNGAADVTLTNVIVSSDGQAEALARSQIERRAAGAAVLTAVAEGDASLAPGICVRLQGVPERFAGPFRITHARHRCTPEFGYIVELSSARVRSHPPRQDASATLGIVADIRDPENLGRVKVRYPAVDDAESDWLHVLAAGAGGKKGLLALPALDDLVLVLCVDDDPAHGIVLGALYGSGGLPCSESKTFKGYAFYSPGGHTIELDDEGSLTLRTFGGTSLELGRKQSRLHSVTGLTIEAPGQTITIAADAVEIERR